MANEITGNIFKYTIDTEDPRHKNGFIAIGSESIVYKGKRIKKTNDKTDNHPSDDEMLRFPCVLKFKQKYMTINGTRVDKLREFKENELKIFDKLRECRSVVRIDDVIEDLGDFEYICQYFQEGYGIIDNRRYFCVVEEYIEGWNLDEYCREVKWELRQWKELSDAKRYPVNYNEFDLEKKASIKKSYNYKAIISYQNQILRFMQNLCDIMWYVTEQKKILHLDIKPENIMVTKNGNEIVLIDFGRSIVTTDLQPYANIELSHVDYSVNEDPPEAQYQYGTLGYAAPECYYQATSNSQYPFSTKHNQGKLSIESDIFSFGATFWECLNIFELTTSSESFSKNSHDFYRDNMLMDDVYCNRDLSCTSKIYHEKLEEIIKKCTRARTNDFTNTHNKNYYHSYKEISNDITDALNSLPTIDKKENVKANNYFKLCGGFLAVAAAILIIAWIYRGRAFSINNARWNSLTATYTETKIEQLKSLSDDMISLAIKGSGDINDTYKKIAEFTYIDGDISDKEAEMLVDLLQKINDNKQLPQRIDEIMKYANTRQFKPVSEQIVRFDGAVDSIGYRFAKAIYNLEVASKVSDNDVLSAYALLEDYQKNINTGNDEFHNAATKLKHCLDNYESVKIIADSKGEDVHNFTFFQN